MSASPSPSRAVTIGYGLVTLMLVGGLGAFILAEVLAYGLRLREDVEATI
jgi:hypothetical protein